MKGTQTTLSFAGNRIMPLEFALSITEIKAESSRIASLLHAPGNPDNALQDALDIDLEHQVTRLGLSIGYEVDRRANFNRDKAEFEYLEAKFDSEGKTPTEIRLADATREIIAEIRPVGGTFQNSEFSTTAELQRLQETVGTYYPSSWIQSSENLGSIAVKPTAGRGNYIAKEPYDSDDIDETVDIINSCLLKTEDAQFLHEKLIEDGDTASSNLTGLPFMSKSTSLQVLEYLVRERFQPGKDLMDSNGKPVGEGWKHGYIIDEHYPTLSWGKQWYRIKTRPGQHVPTLYIPPADMLTRTSLYYHEFCHRAEDTVGLKDSRGRTILHRLQEVFLRRRTTGKDGIRQPLVSLGAKTSDFKEIELGRPSDFMTSYVGKEYIVSHAREVLSVGSEALFSGRFGSFHGLGNKGKKDLDHRAFTLGVLAAV